MNQNLHKKFALAALFLLTVAAGAAEPTTITAEKVKAALPELQKLIEQMMQKTGIPGLAISVVYKDQVIYLKIGMAFVPASPPKALRRRKGLPIQMW